MRLFLGDLEIVIRGAEVRVTAIRLVKSILPLHDHAEVLVVQDEALHRQVFRVQGREFLNIHDERAIAVDVDDQFARTRRGGADGGGQAEAHRTQTTRREPVARLVKLVVLSRPHLVLTDTSGDDRLTFGHLAQQLDRRLRSDDVADLLGNRKRELFALHVNSRAPLREIGHILLERDQLVQSLQRGLDVAKDGAERLLVLTELRRINVDVHNGGALGEFRQLTGHTIVESHAKSEQQISAVDRIVGIHRTVHAKHAQAQIVALRERTETHERVRHGNPRRAAEFNQL